MPELVYNNALIVAMPPTIGIKEMISYVGNDVIQEEPGPEIDLGNRMSVRCCYKKLQAWPM